MSQAMPMSNSSPFARHGHGCAVIDVDVTLTNSLLLSIVQYQYSSRPRLAPHRASSPPSSRTGICCQFTCVRTMALFFNLFSISRHKDGASNANKGTRSSKFTNAAPRGHQRNPAQPRLDRAQSHLSGGLGRDGLAIHRHG